MKLESVLAAKGPKVFTIGPTATVRDAVAILIENNIGAVIVVDAERRPLGIISERDILREFTRTADILGRQVDEVMTADVVTGTPADDVQAVLATMTARNFRHLPVVDDGYLAGMISIRDLVKAQLDEYQGEVETLQTQLMSS